MGVSSSSGDASPHQDEARRQPGPEALLTWRQTPSHRPKRSYGCGGSLLGGFRKRPFTTPS
jgi:hypothetical protein